MSIIVPRLRFRLEHQIAPSWSSEVVTHDECERHLRKLSRTACGCMRYANSIRRPFARIDMASGLSTETSIARLFLTMSADQPLQGSDFACHRCDDPLCAIPITSTSAPTRQTSGTRSIRAGASGRGR